MLGGRAWIVVPAWLYLWSAAAARAQSPAPVSAAAGASAAHGEALFLGTVRFQNGGPACASCHDAAGLPFPGGGSMGPDLTGAARKLGPDGLHSALDTLFFPAMTPLFQYRPLTPAEQGDLAAFLESISGRATPQPDMWLGPTALAGFLILVGATAAAGRRRLHPVRRSLLPRPRARPR